MNHTRCHHPNTKQGRAACRRVRDQVTEDLVALTGQRVAQPRPHDRWVEGAPVLTRKGDVYATITGELKPVKGVRRFELHTPDGERFTALQTDLDLV